MVILIQTVKKYTLKNNESFAHRFTKDLIFNGLISGEIKSFYEKEKSYISYEIYNKSFKKEYPFFRDFQNAKCKGCKETICEKCFYIPNTYIKCISDIAILNNNGDPIQVIEIIHKKELSEKKKAFYLKRNIQVIIIKTEDILRLTHLYTNLKVHQIIEEN